MKVVGLKICYLFVCYKHITSLRPPFSRIGIFLKTHHFYPYKKDSCPHIEGPIVYYVAYVAIPLKQFMLLLFLTATSSTFSLN